MRQEAHCLQAKRLKEHDAEFYIHRYRKSPDVWSGFRVAYRLFRRQLSVGAKSRFTHWGSFRSTGRWARRTV